MRQRLVRGSLLMHARLRSWACCQIKRPSSRTYTRSFWPYTPTPRPRERLALQFGAMICKTAEWRKPVIRPRRRPPRPRARHFNGGSPHDADIVDTSTSHL